MANGAWHGTREEWARLESPLLEIDRIIDEFAEEYGLTTEKNRKGWPERSLMWGSDIRCLIQLYLADQASLAFSLWLCAFQDRAGQRYWKQEFLMEKQPIASFKAQLTALLKEGRDKLVLWSQDPAELKFATGLRH